MNRTALRRSAAALSALALLGTPLVALADVVRPPPASCPPQHTPQTGHHGPYCQPPPPENCPAGHLPRVIRADAYCEPPPQLPCPQGSHWTSTSADDVYCHGGARCEERDCSGDSTCRKTSLCVREVPYRRFGHYEVVLGTCSTDADCRERTKCVAASRCDLDTKRFHPKGVSNPAAKGPVSSPAPPQQSATPMLGTATTAPGVTVIPDPSGPAPADPGAQSPAGSGPGSGCASCSLGAAGPTAPAFEAVFLLLLAVLRRRNK